MRRRRRLAVLAALVVGTGCATPASRGAARARAGRDVESVRVVVENANWQDMVVYMQAPSGARFRLGSVVTGQTAVFVLGPAHMAGGGTIRLMGDPIGGNAVWQTPALQLSPGRTAYWRIGNAEATSFYQIR